MGAEMSSSPKSCCPCCLSFGHNHRHRTKNGGHHRKMFFESGSETKSNLEAQLGLATVTAAEQNNYNHASSPPTHPRSPSPLAVPEMPDFTDKHRTLVRESWVLVEDHISQIGLSMYLELFQRNPETIALFSFLKHLSKEDLEFYSQLKNHAVRVTGTITMLVRQLEHPREQADALLIKFLVDLGRRHFSYGSRPHQMELLGLLFVDSFIHIFDADSRQEEIQKSWLVFFSFIVFWMQSGFKFVQNKGECSFGAGGAGGAAV